LSCVCGGLFLTAAITGWRSGAIPAGWAGYGWGALSVLLLLTLGCFLLVLQLMSQRNSLDFLPLRDYPYFVERVVRLSPAHE
jgi:hypothetical protein